MCIPSFLFLFSKAEQHGLAPFAACSRGRGLSGSVTYQTREVTRCSPLPAILEALNCQNFKRRYLRLHWTFSAASLQILFMLKQQHYTLTNVKKVKSQSTTPLKENLIVFLDSSFSAPADCDRYGGKMPLFEFLSHIYII